MAITKQDLILKGEVLLRRLQKEHRNIRKAYRLKDQDEVDVIARLVVSQQLLTDRIANEAIMYATSPPDISLSPQEATDKRAKAKEINEMLNMTNKIRDLAKNMVADAATTYGMSADAMSDEKQVYIEDAKKQLDELGFSLDELKEKHHIEVINDPEQEQEVIE